MNMNKEKKIKQNQKEFTKQAEYIVHSKNFNDTRMRDELLQLAAVKSNEIVLDLACGPGILTEELAKYAQHVTAVDATEKMIQICQSKNIKNITATQAIAEKLPFADNSFDCIVNRLAIHHFFDPDKVLKEMKRVLKPKGKIIIADVYSSNNIADAELHNTLEILRDPSHTKMLSLKEFEGLFFDNNLKILDHKLLKMQCDLDKWLSVAESTEQSHALKCVIENLINSDKKAGINLHFAKDEIIEFEHSWVIYKLGEL